MTRPAGKCTSRLYKKKRLRLHWKQKSSGEARAVVKGVNKRVVVVKSPDPRIFDEAIFIVRDDFFKKDPDGTKKLLEEAQRAASDYIRSTAGKRPALPRRLRRPLYAAAGAAAAGAAWLAVRFVGVLF